MSKFVRQSKYRHVFGQSNIKPAESESLTKKLIAVGRAITAAADVHLPAPEMPTPEIPTIKIPTIESIEILAIYKAGPRQFHPLNYQLAIIYSDKTVKDETVCSNNIPKAYAPHLTEAKIKQAKQDHKPLLRTRP